MSFQSVSLFCESLADRRAACADRISLNLSLSLSHTMSTSLSPSLPSHTRLCRHTRHKTLDTLAAVLYRHPCSQGIKLLLLFHHVISVVCLLLLPLLLLLMLLKLLLHTLLFAFMPQIFSFQTRRQAYSMQSGKRKVLLTGA